MRTKTLLLAAAAVSVAGLATTMAQVYSVNAVGYVNVTIKPGYNLIANPLDAGAGNNTAAKLFPSVPDGTFVYIFSGGGFVSANFDFGEWDDAGKAMVVAPGTGAFVLSPATADFTVTFVGEVMQGDLKIDLPAGLALVGSKVPQAGKLATDLKFPVADGDFIYKYSPSSGYASFNYDFGEWDTAGEPVIGVAQGFWSLKNAAATWSRTFSVNQ